MRHISLATLAVMILLLAGCGNVQQVPPVPHGPQSWGKGELYASLRNATIKGSATGQWAARRYEKMDYRELNKLSKAEQEALVASGFDPWIGSFKQTPGVTPYRVEQLVIADSLSQGKTYDSKGKEVPLTCLVSTGAGLFREEVVKKEKASEYSSFANLGGRKREYTEQAPSLVIITACAKQAGGAWTLSHVTVEKPKKAATEGGK